MPVNLKTVPKSKAVWPQLRIEAMAFSGEEPSLASFLHAAILNHDSMADALSYQLALKLGGAELNILQLREICTQAMRGNPEIVEAAEADMRAVVERDPAARSFVQPFLFFKGYQALQAYRVAHWLWLDGRELLAFALQSRISELFGVDIHPAAKMGGGIFIDHATGVVIGETSVVGDDVSLLHGVTLGGVKAERGDRHPKIGRGVLIGAGAKVLGNIVIGDNARIAAGSVVLQPVPAGCTAAGVPARLIDCASCVEPSKGMDHIIAGGTYGEGI